MKIFYAVLFMFALFFFGTLKAQTIPSYNDVLLIVNDSSKNSLDIGNYFAWRRSLPLENVFHIAIDTSISYDPQYGADGGETIDAATFYRKVWYPLESYMKANGLVRTINYIVTTKGCPLRVTTDDNNDHFNNNNDSYSGLASFNDCLALINGIDSNEVLVRKAGFLFQSRYYGSTEHFQHDQKKMPMYLTTRLDGYTVQQVKAEIQRAESTALASEGEFVLDEDPSKQFGYGYEVGNLWMDTAATYLYSVGLNVLLDTTSVYLTNESMVIGYTSWGSNDVNCDTYTTHAIPHNSYLNGAIGETYVSTSARSFNPGTPYGQSLIADWIQEGISGIKGYTDEPYVYALAQSQILYNRYVQGFNLAESFAAASQYIPWRQVVIGDPKMMLGTTLTVPQNVLSLLNSSVLDFGYVGVNTSDTLPMRVANNGIVPFTIASLSLVGVDTADYTVLTPNIVGSSVQPGGTANILLSFHPSTKGIHNIYADLISTDNDTSVIPLRGMGVVPGELVASDSLSFGITVLGQTAVRPLTLTNAGQLPVTIKHIVVQNGVPEFFADTNVPITLGPGASATVNIAYTPTIAGDADESMVFYTSGDTVSVFLRGYASANLFSEQPKALTFYETSRSVNAGSMYTQAIALNNFSDSALTITNIQIEDSVQNSFILVRPLGWPYVVAGHGGDSVVVAFHPFAANTEYTGTLLLAVTDGAVESVIRIPLTGEAVVLTGAKEQIVPPQEIALDQNYPNPFGDATDIRFTLPSNSSSVSRVSLAITDVLGREVANLSSAVVADQKSVVFHASSLPEGIYLCKLSDGKLTKVITMLHVK
jgi:uncharacterized protein (TIGR03790 family)